MNKQATTKEAVQDARIMALLFYKIKSGLDTWYRLFEVLEAKYSPFLIDVFRDEFYHYISKHDNFKAFEKQIWGES